MTFTELSWTTIILTVSPRPAATVASALVVRHLVPENQGLGRTADMRMERNSIVGRGLARLIGTLRIGK